ncbi:DUF835 domain-containing protein [Thermococcus sp. Bubb.Bath]|uniref:DUF835 domain-containing protein n=1 Tax=Thermococcus sp. Bubb.Bath TaxID=1638242 RepID=UPI00143A2D6F|nr:DUF835 domain-containing protein [Thermococcus sp. Bubb.Bath]NJF25741.1 DUF835 domain-containing protein [Thermococcus sp. Bubb.Bath]
MELLVPTYQLVYDVTLLIALLYVWYFFAKRWNRYTAELKPFIRSAVVFLAFGVAGRTVDLIADFVQVPYAGYLYVFFYGVSIVGVIYTMVVYVIRLENSYIPLASTSPSQPSPQDKKDALTGAYLIMGSRGKMFEVLNVIKSFQRPTIVFTRNPNFYSELGDFVVPVWITQVTDKGISPTALHVIQDNAIRFVRERPGSLVVIDCLEYLLLYSDFTSVFKFLINLKDHVTSAGSTLVVFADGEALDERERALLLREFEPL